MLKSATSEKSIELKDTLKNINNSHDISKQKVQAIISKEIQKTEDSSPFKAIDFGKESSDFSGSTISAMIGSVASSQANANQANNIRLLS